LVNFESLQRREYVNARAVRVCVRHRALPGSEITYLFHCAHHRHHCSHTQTDRFLYGQRRTTVRHQHTLNADESNALHTIQ
jgi:hypothetical protein